MRRHPLRFYLLTAGLLVVPAVHPLLIPAIGAPSHLLWWLQVLPVALTAFRYGKRGAMGVVGISLGLVVLGERTFGAGYGIPATWETTWSLTAALLGTHLLVAGFALYARATARRYQLLFDNAQSAILRTDARGRVIAANPASLNLFDCRREDLEGSTLDEVPWLEHLPSPEELSLGGWSGTITVGGPGEETTIHVTVAASGGEDPAGHQILLVDRTEDVLRDREMERQGRLAALGATLSGVAHEMKNPLQVIAAYSQLALEPDSSPTEMQEAMVTIRGQSERMNDLVRELLGFSRTDEERSSVRLDELIRGVLRMQRVARGRTVRFEERLRWDGEVQVSAAKIEQILVNLVSNAVDAAPRGRGVVEVELTNEAGDAVVTVADNGPGVDPELADRIFEPFVSTKSKGEGTGLGLAICRRLVTSMGGDLSVANRTDAGAAFTLRIPCEDASATGQLTPGPVPA